MLIDHQGFHVPTSTMPRKRLRELTGALTVTPQATVDFAKPKPFKIYREADGELLVPRAFGVAHLGAAPFRGGAGETIATRLADGFALDESRHQPAAVEATLARLSGDFGSGLLNLFTGAGKTVISCYLIHRIGLKTLILVHKTFLQNQWIDRLRTFLPGVRIGVVQGAKFEAAECDVCIAMIQTLATRQYDAHAFRSFGLLIADECHTLCTKVFNRALQQTQTRFMLGLSATIERKDKLERVLHYHLGDVIFSATRENMTARVKLVYADVSDLHEIINHKTQKPDRVAMVSALVADAHRNDLIVRELAAAARAGRKTLVLSERRQHLVELKRLLDEAGFADSGFYVGGMAQAALTESEGRAVIFGSYSMASTGLDIKDMSCLVLASPLTDVRQACGRILRNVTAHPKLIVDVVDRASVFVGQMRRRVASYHEQGFAVSCGTDGDAMRQTTIPERRAQLAIVDA